MFNFLKKHAVQEDVFVELSDEQLDEVSGGTPGQSHAHHHMKHMKHKKNHMKHMKHHTSHHMNTNNMAMNNNNMTMNTMKMHF